MGRGLRSVFDEYIKLNNYTLNYSKDLFSWQEWNTIVIILWNRGNIRLCHANIMISSTENIAEQKTVFGDYQCLLSPKCMSICLHGIKIRSDNSHATISRYLNKRNMSPPKFSTTNTYNSSIHLSHPYSSECCRTPLTGQHSRNPKRTSSQHWSTDLSNCDKNKLGKQLIWA